MHKGFISFHHANDQFYKDELIRMNDHYGIFIDGSVNTRDISEDLSDEAIRCKIRDYYLRDSTVTIVLVGTQTKYRKHVDWEIRSSMFDGAVNKKSGLLVITLPTTNDANFDACHVDETLEVYPDCQNWLRVTSRAEHELRHPCMPARIIDNLYYEKAMISVVPWDRIMADPRKLSFLIDAAHNDRLNCEYDLSRPMRRSNSNALGLAAGW